MKVSMIAAMSLNRVIGEANTLPWHIPEDLTHFREKTLHGAVIMGRKTYESIGRPLPQRLNIVMTRDLSFKCGALVASTVEEALELAKIAGYKEVMIIGGGEIYRLFLPLASKLYITVIHEQVKGDTYFPMLPNSNQWKRDNLPSIRNHEGTRISFQEISLKVKL